MLTDPSPLSLFSPSFLSAVPYQQNPYTPGSSSTVIQCYRCGDTCKGEVVRVQSNHFHIRCFTCQGRTMLPERLLATLPHDPRCSLESKRLGTHLPGTQRYSHRLRSGSFAQRWMWCGWGGDGTGLAWCRQCPCEMPGLACSEQGC